MVTTEQSIANLTSATEALLPLPQQIADVAQSQIELVGASYQNHLAGLAVTAYVDQVTGDDSNSGAVDSPFKSLDKAFAITPRGGYLHVHLSSDYEIQSELNLAQKFVFIDGGSVRKSLSFKKWVQQIGSTSYRAVHGFNSDQGGAILINNINLIMPEALSTEVVLIERETAGIISGEIQSAPVTLIAHISNIECPTARYGPLIHCRQSSFIMLASTVTGSANLNGRIFGQYQSTAGTDVLTAPLHRSNLATI